MDAVRMGPLPFAYDVHTGLGVLIALLNEADSLLTRRRGRECRRVEREREWNARIIYQCHQIGPCPPFPPPLFVPHTRRTAGSGIGHVARASSAHTLRPPPCWQP